MKRFLLFLPLVLLIGSATLSGCDSATKVHLGDTVTISYTSTFTDGETFQNSGVSFVVGSGQFLKGIEMGIIGMNIGKTKKIIVPADEGYGAEYNAFQLQKISKLVFDKMTKSETGQQDTFFTIAGVRGIIKGIEKDEQGNDVVLRDINPRETRDTLVYKVTLVSKE